MKALKTVDTPKGLGMPARTLPPEALNLQVAFFTDWLEKLLGVKDNQDNEKRIKVLFEAIKENAWSLSINQLQEAFKMYVKGQLPIEPISGFIDVIQFNKIVKAYREAKAPKIDFKQIAYQVNDYYIDNESLLKDGNILNGVEETFNYLIDVGVLPKRKSSERAENAYADKMKKAGLLVLAPLIDERKKLNKEGLGDSPRVKKIQEEIKLLVEQKHPQVKKVFKRLVLESFFSKNRHLRGVL